jgi:drug/metabolite transporter (DMT)-like permease
MGDKAHRLNLLLAFGAVYFLWGSTYLAIAYAIDTLPPLLMAGVRFLIGGSLFWLWGRHKGAPKPTANQWRWGLFAGLLMIGIGGGGVHWAEQFVPSGLTALIITVVPFFVVMVDWLRPGGTRPGWPVLVGIAIGFSGLYLLVGAKEAIVNPSGYLLGSGVLLIAGLAWAIGSIVSRYADMPVSQHTDTAIKLWAGGLTALIAGTLNGEWSLLNVSQVSVESLLALAYLIIFGSTAFAAYNWLLKYSTPARAATYAYVNPVVAVLLGVLLAGEPFTPRIAIAMAVIIAAVMIIVNYKKKPTAEETVDKSPRGVLLQPCNASDSEAA